MKKLSIILLAVLLTVSLFVSCDNTTKAVTDERVAVTFSTGTGSRGLNYVIENVSELKWYYAAQKNNADHSPFAFGATAGTEITLGDTVEFSQGLWDFTLWAKRVDNGATVYKGNITGVLITKGNSPSTIVIDVFPKVEGSTGSIELNNVKITKKDSTDTVFANKAVINGEEILIGSDTHIGEKTGLTPGDYDVKVMYTYTVVDGSQTQELVYASETITVTVWSGRTTTVSGNLSELTGSATINIVPSIATIQKTVSASEPTVFSANVAPSNNAQSTTLDKTIVTFPAGTLENGSTATLEVNVSPIYADFPVGVVGSSTPVGAISLKLNDAESSRFEENEVTVETYIAKNLSNVKVYYGADEITGSTYESSTGMLVFKTTHFSEFYVGAAEVEAYNTNQNKVYAELQDAINNSTEGNVILILKDINHYIEITKSIIVDGLGRSTIYGAGGDWQHGIGVNFIGSNLNATIKNLTINVRDNITTGYTTTGILVDASKDNSVFNIENCVVSAGHYAVYIAANSSDITLNIKKSNLTGWGAINVWGSNNNIYCYDSTLTGIGNHVGASFGTLVFEGAIIDGVTYKASDCNIEIHDSNIYTINNTTNSTHNLLQANMSSENNKAKLFNSNIFFKNIEGNNKSTVGYINLKGTGNSLYIDDVEFSSCWYSNGPFNPSKNVSGSFREDFLAVMKNGYLAAGDGIVLESNIIINNDISYKSESNDDDGDVYLYFDNHTISGGHLILVPNNPVISDVSGLGESLFCCDERYTITEETITDPFDGSKNAYKYTVV